jgi:peptidoglycan hydrolase-like protein with peptidoglycan-binding domain
VDRAHEESVGTGEPSRTAEAPGSDLAQGSPADIARLMRAQPAQRDAILAALHRTRGNAFVQQVVTASHAHDDDDIEMSEDAPPTAGGSLDRYGGNLAGDGVIADIRAGAKTLKRGDKGPAVRKVQVALRDLGISVNIHGTYDARTEHGVKDLQGRAKLKPSGEVDATTFEALEARFRSRVAYANAAKENNPNHYQFDFVDEKNPPNAIVRNVHTLGDDERADARKAMGAPAVIDPFKPEINGQTYQLRLDQLLRKKVDEELANAKGHEKARNKYGTFDMPHMSHVGNAAKRAADQVFGTFKTGEDFHAGNNLHDKMTAEKHDVATAKDPAAVKEKKARARVEKIINTNDDVEKLNREHNADRTRQPEGKIIDTLRDIITLERQEDLLTILYNWSASANDDGVRISFRRSGDDDDNRRRLWSMFGTLVHEYIHKLAHPAWLAWRKIESDKNPEAGATLREGVTELLTRSVLSVTNVNDPKLRKEVEGELFDASGSPQVNRNGSYPTETRRAEQLAGVVGIHNIFAAYFAGQTKLVGDDR